MKVGDVYRKGLLDVRRIGEFGEGRRAGFVWYTRPRGYEVRQGAHHGRWMKVETWRRWAAKAQFIENQEHPPARSSE